MNTETTHEPGCYVDGHWGWRAIPRMIELFSDDPSELRLASAYDKGWQLDSLYDAVHDIADDVESRLNDSLPANLVAHWRDGEFFISTYCGDECADEECYCHEW